MSLAIVYSRASSGISAPLVTVETHLAPGMPNFFMAGLPETAVKESKYRVRAALLNAGFEFPRGRITINLAPADLPKDSGRFDLPIALGILAASGQIPGKKLHEYEFTGELALSGDILAVRGILPVALSARQAKRSLIVPRWNAEEAALVKEFNAYSASHLLQVCAYLSGTEKLPICEFFPCTTEARSVLDLADVRGQPFAKRALEVAAAGKHSLLLIGPPGTGKTMLASRLTGILPPLTEQEALEVAAVASISSKGFNYLAWETVPFRSPHHSTSSVALVGGGRPPRPGEISLAHHGVLFLDELPEFSRNVLESLREPLESGCISISRAAYQATFPAQFQLIAAMNPCPCGYAGSPRGNCRCTEDQIQRYVAKLSGPLLDRIDMHVEVPALLTEVLAAAPTESVEDSSQVKQRVITARNLQISRQSKSNAEMSAKDIEQYCPLDVESRNLLNLTMKKFNLSARVYHRIIKIARTIADLNGSEIIQINHIGESLAYRSLDRGKYTI